MKTHTTTKTHKAKPQATATAAAPTIIPPSPSQPALSIRSIDDEIARRQRELETLLLARNILAGIPAPPMIVRPATPHLGNHTGNGRGKSAGQALTIADAAETILGESPAGVHVRDLRTRLASRFAIKTTEKNLVNTLNRWLAKGQRFKRVAPSTYTASAQTFRRAS